jgi:hypothetical protein
VKPEQRSKFERAAKDRPPGLIVEFWGFLRHNKKWWLLPILLVLFALGALLFVASTGLAPLLYPFF